MWGLVLLDVVVFDSVRFGGGHDGGMAGPHFIDTQGEI